MVLQEHQVLAGKVNIVFFMIEKILVLVLTFILGIDHGILVILLTKLPPIMLITLLLYVLTQVLKIM